MPVRSRWARSDFDPFEIVVFDVLRIAEAASSRLEGDERHAGDVAVRGCGLVHARPERDHLRLPFRCRIRLRPGTERIRPAPVVFDDLIDLGHDADGLVQGDNDLLVMGDVLVRERATLPVLEPLVADLVAADFEVPDLLGYALETYRAGLRSAVAIAGVGLARVEPDRIVRPSHSADFRPAGALVRGNQAAELR